MKAPLVKKRTDFSQKGIFTPEGLREVREIYAGRHSSNHFDIKPNPPAKPRWFCQEKDCTRWVDGDGQQSGGTCASYCLYY